MSDPVYVDTEGRPWESDMKGGFQRIEIGDAQERIRAGAPKLPKGTESKDAMRPRFLSTKRGTFRVQEWDGVNRAGLKPLCDNVLVRVDEIADVLPSGLHTTEQAQETGTLGSTTGVIIAVGPQAFAYDMDRLVKWEGERPKPGDRIWFQRYAGQEHTGLDGKLYRIMQDRTIAGMEDKEAMALIAAEGEADQVVRRARA